MRLIDADALRNEVDTWGCNDFDKYDFLEAIDKAPTVKAYTFEEVESIRNEALEFARNSYERPQGEWIAVKDRLPDTDGEYLVSLDNGRIVVADERSIIENHDFEPRMMAWQPLPEPYKKGGAE